MLFYQLKKGNLNFFYSKLFWVIIFHLTCFIALLTLGMQNSSMQSVKTVLLGTKRGNNRLVTFNINKNISYSNSSFNTSNLASSSKSSTKLTNSSSYNSYSNSYNSSDFKKEQELSKKNLQNLAGQNKNSGSKKILEQHKKLGSKIDQDLKKQNIIDTKKLNDKSLNSNISSKDLVKNINSSNKLNKNNLNTASFKNISKKNLEQKSQEKIKKSEPKKMLLGKPEVLDSGIISNANGLKNIQKGSSKDSAIRSPNGSSIVKVKDLAKNKLDSLELKESKQNLDSKKNFSSNNNSQVNSFNNISEANNSSAGEIAQFNKPNSSEDMLSLELDLHRFSNLESSSLENNLGENNLSNHNSSLDIFGEQLKQEIFKHLPIGIKKLPNLKLEITIDNEGKVIKQKPEIIKPLIYHSALKQALAFLRFPVGLRNRTIMLNTNLED